MDKKGIDISYAQGAIDWQQLKGNVDFVMVRSGYGKNASQKDSMFDKHMDGVKSIGIPFGFYHYAYCDSVARARAEAALCLSIIKDYNPTYPVAYDIEDTSQTGVSKSLLTDCAIAFCDEIRAAGFRPMVYANASWLNNRLDAKRLEDAGIGIWCAQWNATLTYKGKVDIWQYSSNGTVPGINGRVDMNYGYVKYPTYEIPPMVEGPTVECGCEPVPRYKKLTDIPTAWNFQSIIGGLMDAGILKGDGSDPDGNDDIIDLSHDMVRQFVVNSRAGIYDAAYLTAGLNPFNYR